MIARGDRSIADLLLAFGRLRPRDGRTREAITRRLGFAAPSGRGRATRHQVPLAVPAPAQPRPAALPSPPLSEPPVARTRLEPRQLASEQRGAPWLAGESLSPVDLKQLIVPLPYQPLLPPGQEQGLLFHSVATSAENGPVDVRRLVELLAAGKPIASLPRLPAPSLFRGVDLLIDLGEAMEPYARDQRELAVTIGRLVGSAYLRVLRFRGCPLRGAGAGPAWGWRPFLRPNGHRPALILGGLGYPEGAPVRDTAPVVEWARFADAFSRQGVPLIVLTPFAVERLPRELRSEISIVHWDRSTSVGAVRRARRRVGR